MFWGCVVFGKARGRAISDQEAKVRPPETQPARRRGIAGLRQYRSGRRPADLPKEGQSAVWTRDSPIAPLERETQGRGEPQSLLPTNMESVAEAVRQDNRVPRARASVGSCARHRPRQSRRSIPERRPLGKASPPQVP